MKIPFIQKMISRYLMKEKQQGIINFVATHPRMFTILAGVGISLAFSSVGRFFVHEALAITSNSVTSAATTIDTAATYHTAGTFQVDYVDNTPITKVPGHVTNVALPTHCDECASPFAPGHEAVSPGDAKDFAPGGLDKSPGDAQSFAPGHVFKKELP